MRHNRLILFRPGMWHAPGPGFGSGPADGRLVQTFHFRRRDGGSGA